VESPPRIITTLDSLKEKRFSGDQHNNDIVYSTVVTQDKFDRLMTLKQGLSQKLSVTMVDGDMFQQCRDPSRKMSTLSEYYDAESYSEFQDTIDVDANPKEVSRPSVIRTLSSEYPNISSANQNTPVDPNVFHTLGEEFQKSAPVTQNHNINYPIKEHNVTPVHISRYSSFNKSCSSSSTGSSTDSDTESKNGRQLDDFVEVDLRNHKNHIDNPPNVKNYNRENERSSHSDTSNEFSKEYKFAKPTKTPDALEIYVPNNRESIMALKGSSSEESLDLNHHIDPKSHEHYPIPEVIPEILIESVESITLSDESDNEEFGHDDVEIKQCIPVVLSDDCPSSEDDSKTTVKSKTIADIDGFMNRFSKRPTSSVSSVSSNDSEMDIHMSSGDESAPEIHCEANLKAVDMPTEKLVRATPVILKYSSDESDNDVSENTMDPSGLITVIPPTLEGSQNDRKKPPLQRSKDAINEVYSFDKVRVESDPDDGEETDSSHPFDVIDILRPDLDLGRRKTSSSSSSSEDNPGNFAESNSVDYDAWNAMIRSKDKEVVPIKLTDDVERTPNDFDSLSPSSPSKEPPGNEGVDDAYDVLPYPELSTHDVHQPFIPSVDHQPHTSGNEKVINEEQIVARRRDSSSSNSSRSSEDVIGNHVKPDFKTHPYYASPHGNSSEDIEPAVLRSVASEPDSYYIDYAKPISLDYIREKGALPSIYDDLKEPQQRPKSIPVDTRSNFSQMFSKHKNKILQPSKSEDDILGSYQKGRQKSRDVQALVSTTSSLEEMMEGGMKSYPNTEKLNEKRKFRLSSSSSSDSSDSDDSTGSKSSVRKFPVSGPKMVLQQKNSQEWEPQTLSLSDDNRQN